MYGNLSSYSMKDHYVCPTCEEKPSYTQLKPMKKNVYTRHKRFFPRSYPYRRI